MSYGNLILFFMRRFRRKRLRYFRETFPPDSCRTIIDVGGSPQIWRMLGYASDITLVNTDPLELSDAKDYRTVIADGKKLPYGSRSFDLAFSNSVIEHVGGWDDMQRLASELRRVGRSYYCQTPNKWFPVEPHLGTLFLHWFPHLFDYYFVVRYMTLWGLMNKPSREQAKKSISGIKLLTRKQLRELFPDAVISVENFMLMPKSYIAIRR